MMDVDLAIIGGGPAGLMAAEVITDAGQEAHLFDAMPSLGRKFLMAGKSGLNLTHGEGFEAFLSRYGESPQVLQGSIERFRPDDIRNWAQGLGIETFIGSSKRVFPAEMKAAPLLRAWLRRLRSRGLTTHVRRRWQGWDDTGALIFHTDQGVETVRAKTMVLALGGASWRRLGSDGAWRDILLNRALKVAPFKPSNCGFDVDWSDHFRSKFAGEPVKSVGLSVIDRSLKGDFVISEEGLEGSAVYTLAADLRDEIDAHGAAELLLDLRPDRSLDRLRGELARPRGSRSFSSHLKRATGLSGVKSGLLREVLTADEMADTERLVRTIKALPIKLTAPRPIDEAISTAGGLTFSELDENLMIRALPGVFAAGEMLDWDAPTGGYLLSACFATGRTAGAGALNWLSKT